MAFRRVEHCVEMFIPEASDELIRVQGLDVELGEDRRGEIAQVERDDEASPAVNRRRQDVTVVRVGEEQIWDEGLVPGNEAIGNVLIHQTPAAGEARRRDVGSIAQDVSGPLVVDFLRPTSLE